MSARHLLVVPLVLFASVLQAQEKQAKIKVTIANPLTVYVGDLQSHTSYCDGTLLPWAAHDCAREVAKLDVCCLTAVE